MKSKPEEYLDKYYTRWSGEVGECRNTRKYNVGKTGHTHRGWLIKTGEIEMNPQPIAIARTENDKIRDYLNFCGAWFYQHAYEIVAGAVKPDEMPKREDWEKLGAPLPVYHHHYRDGYIIGGWYAEEDRVYNPDFTVAEDRNHIMFGKCSITGKYPEAYLPNRAEWEKYRAEQGETIEIPAVS